METGRFSILFCGGPKDGELQEFPGRFAERLCFDSLDDSSGWPVHVRQAYFSVGITVKGAHVFRYEGCVKR